MTGESNLSELLKGMTPILNDGEYIFSTINDMSAINREDTICEFKEKEGTTIGAFCWFEQFCFLLAPENRRFSSLKQKR